MSSPEKPPAALTREITRLLATVRPLLRADWLGAAGKKVRATLQAISNFAKQHGLNTKDLVENAIELGRHKIQGVAEQERAAAIQKFAEAEKLTIEATLERRVLESRVRKEEAEARLKELEVVKAEAELLTQLHALDIVVKRDEKGNFAVSLSPSGLDLRQLTDSSREAVLEHQSRPKKRHSKATGQTRFYRDVCGLTRSELAQLAGISLSTLTRIENGQRVSPTVQQEILTVIDRTLRQKGEPEVTIEDLFQW